jgi:hypothetical protein
MNGELARHVNDIIMDDGLGVMAGRTGGAGSLDGSDHEYILEERYFGINDNTTTRQVAAAFICSGI